MPNKKAYLVIDDVTEWKWKDGTLRIEVTVGETTHRFSVGPALAVTLFQRFAGAMEKAEASPLMGKPIVLRKG